MNTCGRSKVKDSSWHFIDQMALKHKYQIWVEKYSAPEHATTQAWFGIHIRRSKKVTLTSNMFIVCTFTCLVDWTNKGQLWMLKGHRCSVLGDWLPLDQPSSVFFCILSSLLLCSFLLCSLSFVFPQLFSLYQTPSRIRTLLARSAKSSRFKDLLNKSNLKIFVSELLS